jgi:hypothetical protein
MSEDRTGGYPSIGIPIARPGVSSARGRSHEPDQSQIEASFHEYP